MLILLSPSKTINFKDEKTKIATKLQFVDEAAGLVKKINNLGGELGVTLGVSDKLAEENRERFLKWKPDPDEGEGGMAAWAYRGETFFGLSIEQMDEESREYAQEHLRIISGLYGLLRPQDAIMPYRLEIVTKLSGSWGKNLYDFWADKLSKCVAKQNPGFVLVCASDAYAKAVTKHLPKDIMVVTPKFLSPTANGLKSKMAFAKYSRGLMARWAIENRIEDPEELKNFNVEGYKFDEELSTDTEFVFIAPEDFSLKGRFTKVN